jgi:hypothetical protein
VRNSSAGAAYRATLWKPPRTSFAGVPLNRGTACLLIARRDPREAGRSEIARVKSIRRIRNCEIRKLARKVNSLHRSAPSYAINGTRSSTARPGA